MTFKGNIMQMIKRVYNKTKKIKWSYLRFNFLFHEEKFKSSLFLALIESLVNVYKDCSRDIIL